jgi:hypothetical protein
MTSSQLGDGGRGRGQSVKEEEGGCDGRTKVGEDVTGREERAGVVGWKGRC